MILPQEISYKLEKQGYCTQVDEEIHRIYINSSDEDNSFNKKRIISIENMPAIQQIPDSKYKRPLFTVNDKKMPAG